MTTKSERRLRDQISADLMACADEIESVPPTQVAGVVGQRIDAAARAAADAYRCAARRVANRLDHERARHHTKRGP